MKRRSDTAAVLSLAAALVAASAQADRLKLCALISYRLARITRRDSRKR